MPMATTAQVQVVVLDVLKDLHDELVNWEVINNRCWQVQHYWQIQQVWHVTVNYTATWRKHFIKGLRIIAASDANGLQSGLDVSWTGLNLRYWKPEVSRTLIDNNRNQLNGCNCSISLPMSALTHSFFAVASLNTNMKATLKYQSRLNYLANQIKDDDYDVCIQNFHHCNTNKTFDECIQHIWSRK